MKKIFLTSGLVLCMACPAFAETGFPSTSDGNTVTGACVEDTLGQQILTDERTTLQAIWNAKTYDVIYNKGEHAASGVNDYTDTNGATYNQNYTALGAAATGVSAATGYVFLGYSPDATPAVTRAAGQGAVNTGTVDNPWTGETPWTLTADKTVYAAYLAKQYTVSYSCGSSEGITGTIADQIVTYDTAFTANNGSSCVWDGHTFTGWDCGTGVTLPSDGSDWNIDGDVSCTATWDANTIGITWELDGGTAGATAGAATCTYGGSVQLPSAPTKTGYDFGGWAVVENEPETQTAP